MGKLKEFYRSQYKRLLIIPFLILILSVSQIIYQTATTGDFIKKDVDLKGGISFQLNASEPIDVLELEEFLSSKFPEADISVQELTVLGQQTDVIVKSTLEVNETTLIDEIKGHVGKISYTPSLISSKFGESFFRSTFIALGIAFVLMGTLVYLYFRVPIPTLAVILAAISDILATVATLNILGIRLTPGGIAALLMLIGYSVDTDILLSTRVLKRHEGEVFDRVLDAMKTGLTMSATTLGAIIVGIVFARAEILKQIMVILLIGLIFDLIMTWLQNAGLLRWYVERKK
ncbi:protein translocase subunit SecF [Candidatus Woesearchaeota archaeon]|nr:protein translocase subunit SecF [Candidatus Woesearchaeota archaeon]